MSKYVLNSMSGQTVTNYNKPLYRRKVFFCKKKKSYMGGGLPDFISPKKFFLPKKRNFRTK